MQTTSDPTVARGPVGWTPGRRERVTRVLAERLRSSPARPLDDRQRPALTLELPGDYRALDIPGPAGSGFAIIGIRAGGDHAVSRR